MEQAIDHQRGAGVHDYVGFEIPCHYQASLVPLQSACNPANKRDCLPGVLPHPTRMILIIYYHIILTQMVV
jgi:hypothetical protein